ncbi:methionine adenosyltransferase [Methanolobus halotolerans]|uniref:S-adenosylmethionine synthetase n=1 Tax=Methanolobus halotolerans TaxID=2052935 RepID=A0A4E0QSF5_9EURY|nr:methionine adenosyltransferase [Methanolobus halotolerans]TGC09858.1 S-adenosylmethionine synthetase [Methanolobus halotolerans]
MRNITVEEFKSSCAAAQQLEIVERKGLGHPDSICDAIMDNISVRLSGEYLQEFGEILHHNVDKCLLVAGEVTGIFGGGMVTQPMLLVIGDRATFSADGKDIDVCSMAIDTATRWFDENLRFVEPEYVDYQVELKPGSAELTDIFRRKGEVLGANDSSAAVGYAPLSFTESMVLDTEKYLNSPDFKEQYPESGEDIKVMGVRKGNDFDMTVAMPVVDRFLESEEHYFRMKNNLTDAIDSFISGYVEEKGVSMNTTFSLNNLDMPGRGMNGIYTTVTGTSAEDADCGQVGRGNRVNGIIPLNRPVSSEAAAGKNPVSHVGKIYNILSHRIADRIYNNVPDVEEAYVWLLSDIGVPIDKPKVAAAQLIMKKGTVESVQDEVTEVIDKELENIGEFTMELARGMISLY